MRLLKLTLITIPFFFFDCSKDEPKGLTPPPIDDDPTSDLPAPPATWKEHWFEHEQLVTNVFHDEHLALYYDDNVNPSYTWPQVYISDMWEYVKSVYGDFGDDPRLYAILHTDRYSGGHPAVYMDAGHDYRNVVDVGPYTWEFEKPSDGLSVLTHEVGHIVEGAAKGVKDNPAWEIWKDSKWAEIFIYDVYLGLGKTEYAQQVYNDMMNQTDDYPTPGSQWFKDWFYPLYSQNGGSKVLNEFYELLAKHFPRNADGTKYARRMNWGEFIHFWSGAAGKDLKPLAEQAFGWPEEWTDQLYQAKADFDKITY